MNLDEAFLEHIAEATTLADICILRGPINGDQVSNRSPAITALAKDKIVISFSCLVRAKLWVKNAMLQ